MTRIRRADDDASELDRWLGELRADAGGRERARRRVLAQAATEEATWQATVTDLAERGEPVVVEVSGDRLLRGRVRLVGPDVVVLRDGRTDAVVRLDAVASIRLRPDVGAASRPAPLAPRPEASDLRIGFARVLARLAETSPRVTVHRLGASAGITGELAAVGDDVLVLLAPPAGAVYVPLWSVVDVSLTGSG